MSRHVIGVRPSVAVVTVVEVIAVGALILMPLWWAIGSVAATALALSVTVHGSTAPGWVGTLWRWRAARRTPPTVPPAVDITAGDTVCGVRIGADEAVAMIRLAGRAHRPTFLRDAGTAITEDVLPLRILTEHLQQPGGLHLDIDVVSVGRRVRPSSGYPALYSTLLGARAAIGQRSTVLLLRLNLPASSTGLGYRESVGSAVAGAAERLINGLRQAGVRAAAATATELDAALAGAGGGLLTGDQPAGRPKRPELRWRGVKTRDGYLSGYYLSPEDITTGSLNRLWALHADTLTITVTLRARGRVEVAATVQVVTAQPPPQPPTLDLRPLPGRQHAAIGWSAPTVRPGLPVPFGPLGDPAQLQLPVGPCGVLIGAATGTGGGCRRDDFVTLPLTDPADTTRIAMNTDPGYVRALLMRAAAVGERVSIHTATPHTWTGLADPNIAVAAPGCPFVPTIIVNDHALTTPAHGLAATLITLGDDAGADIRFTQDGDTVRLHTPTGVVDVAVITFLREEGWTG